MTEVAAAIRRTAMDLLARREHSYRELADKLALRYPQAQAQIQQELERLREQRLQSDERFAESFLHGRTQQLYGPQRIRAELRQRGVEEALIEAALAAAAIDWQANLQRLISGKFGRQPPGDARELARRFRFLQYRGFTQDQIRQCGDDPAEVD